MTFLTRLLDTVSQVGDNVENYDALMFESSEIGGDAETMRIAGSTEAFKIDPNL